MQRERIFAVIVGLVMLLSVVGFAATGFRFGTEGQGQEYTIPTITNRTLNGQEISTILSYGRVVAQSVYGSECPGCVEKDAEMRRFASRYEGFLVLESVKTEGDGWVKFQMIGSNGQITSLEGKEITQENLLDIFCELAVVKPRECLLKIYDEWPHTPASNATENATAAS